MTSLTTLRTGVRAATSGAPLVTRRRAVSDVGILLLGALVLAVTVALCLVIPGLVAQAADEAVRAAVVHAGTSADLVTRVGTNGRTGFGSSVASGRDPNIATTLRENAASVHDALPDALATMTGPGVVSVSTPVTKGLVGPSALATRLVYIGDPEASRQAGLVHWVDGTPPAAAPLPDLDPAEPLPPHEVQVGMEASAAARFGVHAGDVANVALPTFGHVDLVITGLYTVSDPTSGVWTSYPDLLGPREAASTDQVGRAALLVSDASLPDVELVVKAHSLVTQFRYVPDPALIDAASSTATITAVTHAETDATALTQAAGGPTTLQTSLGSTLDSVRGRLAAARAQQSVLVLGLGGVGALVLVLAARLLVARREPFLLAERARGASIVSVVLRGLLESVPIAAVAACAGALAAGFAPQGVGSGGEGVAVALVVVAALAPAAVAALHVRTAFAGRRTPANRADRDRLRSRRRARRIVAEATLCTVAVGAVVSVRRRGLTQTSTGGVDLLLAATPLLVAAAATLVVVKAMPPLLRALSRSAAKRPGLVPVVATARASAAQGTAVPLLTLTVAVGLIVFCGTTAATVSAGQRTAADARTGADVRVEGTLTDQDVSALRAQPDVTAVAGIAVLSERTLGRDSGTTADLVLVDADPLAAIEAAHGRSTAGLRRLTDHAAQVPALVSPSLSTNVRLVPPQLATNTGTVTLDVVGTVGDEPRVHTDSGEQVDGRVLVDRTTFDHARGAATEPTTILVDGPGALAASRMVGLEGRQGVTVTSRTGWLQTWQASPLNRDLVLLLLATSALLAVYAALALVLMVAATSRDRARALSAMRTLGLDTRTASALTGAELAPVAGAAIVGGTVIGILIPWLTSDALGLELVTGGFGPPALRLTWWPVVGAVAVVAVALAVAVLVEGAIRRRDHLGDVLRVGER